MFYYHQIGSILKKKAVLGVPELVKDLLNIDLLNQDIV